ncbi:LysM peptidoglycan-binding domain-containing protein [Phenylobacterium sp.]|uniref:LysM peptidoglycan-binding domain-containing protein n=1 Tax=Phenylobacterium sp. TaxID=1871053 RepID=UPI002DE475E4|nr:LysM peptidoglycan-binding domain-containing protein [Phenylobacterium sp.]
MTQILARSVLALFASSALVAGAGAAGASPSAHATPAVMRDGADAPQLILAATHHRKHHAAAKGSAHKATSHHRGHRKGHHAAQAAADEADAGVPGANGHVTEVASAGETYKVKKGDNLAKVAAKLGVEVAELKKLNKIKGTSIRAGQVLKGPGSTEKAYVAARGDTVAAVAKRFGVTEKALKSQNGLSRRGVSLKSGQRLTLPEGARDHGAPKADTETATSRRMRGRLTTPAEDEAPIASAGADRGSMGRVTEVPGPPRTYRTRKGDTLEKVADRLGVSVSQLKKQNHLRSSHLRRGQTLHAPGGMVKAYVVGPSDTTYGIAKRFGVSIEALRAANGMGRRGTIHTGERLRLPSGYRDHGPTAAERPVIARPYSTPQPDGGGARPAGPQPYVPVPVPIPTGPRAYSPPMTPGAGPAQAPTSSPPPTDAQISELGRGRFLWPLRGEILSEFGPKAEGQRNDGINIQASVGDAVHAAAAGEVAYAGDQVPGYGNLVLITHPDGWVTAYSHLSRLEVKMQQKVTQGQEIGQAGSTGGVSAPQLHFEVRYRPNNLDRARPIDPKLVLPR